MVAKLAGYAFQRFLKLPRVLGELATGIVIGPYALGSLPILFGHPLFPPPEGATFYPEFNIIIVLAAVVLLFLTGLETNVRQFIRFSGFATVVAVGGIVLPFFLSALTAYIFLPHLEEFFHIKTLFWGVATTATSISLTARILAEQRKMATPEAATILGSAVLDDVLVIIILAIFVGTFQNGGAASFSEISRIALRTLGFWLGTSVLGILLVPYLVSGLKKMRSLEIIAGFSFGLALLVSGLVESVGLSAIIGSYIIGLSLSQTDVVDQLRKYFHGVYQLLVPVFFVSIGMMVDLSQITPPIFLFGLVFSLVAILGKLIGSGGAAFLSGFTLRGSLRIGAGMVPRGEVSLIIAGAALNMALIEQRFLGSIMMMMLISSVVAPSLISFFFRGKGGLRKRKQEKEDITHIEVKLPKRSLVWLLVEQIVEAFREEEFFVTNLSREDHIYQIRKEKIFMTLQWDEQKLTLATQAAHEQLARFIILEEIIELKDLANAIHKDHGSGLLEDSSLRKFFSS